VKARLLSASAVMALSLALCAASLAEAGDSEPAAKAHDRAEAVLRRAEALLAGHGTYRGDLTPLLLRLVRAYPSLPPSGRARADRVLARPTDHPDPDGNAWHAPEAAASPACSPNFCVHWVEKGVDAPSLKDSNRVADGDGIPDWVEVNELVAERVYATENTKLRWRAPKSDGGRGGGRGMTDIYLADVGGLGLFGYAAPDRGQTGPEHRFRRSLFAYLVMDDDFSRSQFPGTTPLGDLEVTLAHEYNHILQFTYDSYQDLWMLESTAVWMEDQVYDSINDYRRYLRRWVRLRRVPLTSPTIKVYGSAVWNHWLQRRYGADMIRRAWARAVHVHPPAFSVATYDRAIRRAGPSTFNLDFARFCRDLAEWRTGTVFPEGGHYPDFGRSGRLLIGHQVERRLNHTTAQLLKVNARGNRTLRVHLTVPRGVNAGLALVGRIGGERQGRVLSRLDYARRGGSLSVRMSRLGRFDRITAVLVNADGQKRGFDPLAFDWRYLHDSARFRVSARLGG
jgi:hypothetical protein